MKLLFVTDIHGNRRRSRKLFESIRREGILFDYVLIGGDLTHFQGIDVALEITSILCRLGRRCFFIPGNCDHRSLLNMEKLGMALNIHGRLVELERGLNLIGLGGSTITPFNTSIEFTEEEISKLLPDPKKPFILMSHTPPYKTQIDRTWRGEHVGSRVIREYILKNNPVLSLHGHIHEARGRDTLGSTIIINPGPLQNGYYAIIDLPDNLLDIKVEFYRC